jgi:hypothetical protein
VTPPLLVVVTGMPSSGKTTVTEDLARRAGVSVIVEGNFFRDQAREFAALPAHRLVQHHWEAPLPVLLDRYAKRTRRAGHHDAEKIGELPGRFASGAHGPLSLDGELIRLDTTQPVDLAARIRDFDG